MELNFNYLIAKRNHFPIYRGKIVYSPKNAAFDEIMRTVNSTFGELSKVQDLAELWIDVISPTIRDWLDGLNTTSEVDEIPTDMNDQIDS
jgi:hypothetical protein